MTRWPAVALTSLALALTGLLPSPAAAASSDPCDFPAQSSGSLTVCEQSTGALGIEPTVVRNRRGTLFMGMATDDGVYGETFHLLNGTATSQLLRSRDDGRSWQRVDLPPGVLAAEGVPAVDPVTDRLYVTSFSVDLTRCGQPVVWSDDEGATWGQARKRPGCWPTTIGDWPKIFAGPYHHGIQLGSAPTAVYQCNFVPNLLITAAIGCWRSDDGGRTFAFASFLPVLNGLCVGGDVRGGLVATIVHGAGVVLANGDVVVPVNVCGRMAVARSTDNAKTWKVKATGGVTTGLVDVLTLKESLPQAVSQSITGQNLAIDDDGTLFLAYVGHGVHVDVSRDGGLTWRQLGIITPPEVVSAVDVSITARGSGEVALAYYGSADRSQALDPSTQRWRGWISHSQNALAASPTFDSAPSADSAVPPMLTSTIQGCCFDFQAAYFFEYTGIVFAGPGEVRAAFAREPGKGANRHHLVLVRASSAG